MVTNARMTRLAFGQGNWSGMPRVLCPEGEDQSIEPSLSALYPQSSWQTVLARSLSSTRVDHTAFDPQNPEIDLRFDPAARARISFISERDVALASDPSLGWRAGAVHLTMPDWIAEFAEKSQQAKTAEDRLALAVELSRRNVEAKTGGPFGSALYTPDGEVYAIGVNRVFPQDSSVLHGEMMAYLRALARYHTELSRSVGGYRLSSGGLILATSCDPCVQCWMATLDLARFGFVSGMDRAGHADDARSIKFDEGELPPDAERILREKGIVLTDRALRDDAARVLQAFLNSGALIYNADADTRAKSGP
jgi:tRNA(Arg) A34 adenosine deaminase TadA